MFSDRSRKAWLVLHLMDGNLIGGVWNFSYAAGYPDDQDIYLSEQVQLTSDGRFQLSEDGLPLTLEKGLLIRWSEVRYIDWYEA